MQNLWKADVFMLFSRRDLFKIILPLFAEQLLAVTVGMCDSMMVSSAGEAAVSGVSLVDSINLFLIYVFSAFGAGGAVVCSQFMGKKDYVAARTSAKQLVYSVLAVSILIMTVALVFRTTLLKLIFGSIEADVMFHAKNYFLFTALSFPFIALYNSGAAIFRSMGNSKVSMFASIITNSINIIGNAIFIFKFRLGAAGAAIATLIARAIGATIMMVLVRNKHNPIYLEKMLRVKLDFPIIKRILGIGIPSGLENGMFQLGKLITQGLISGFGTAAIAANSVASHLAAFEYSVGNAIGLAMVTVVGQCIGAGDKGQAKKYALKLLGIEYAVIIFVSALFSILAKPLIGIYNFSAEGSSIAFTLIIIHNIFTSTVWPVSFTLSNSFRAASDVRYPMAISILSMWIFRVGFSYVFALGLGLGLLGVWLAMFTDWTFRAICFAIRFLRGKWLTKYKPLETTT